jgi:uncharacterized oxidoreductase
METSGRTVLVTGGGSGIGWGIAQRFLDAGSTVIICGRREDRLREVQRVYPSIHIRRCDVAEERDRHTLVEWAATSFPTLDVLVNNAGIQRYVQLSQPEPWGATQHEIAVNLEAPVDLCRLFLPHFLRKTEATIVNVTSGLAFVPIAQTPIYCATKAALHSFTLSLRHQLRGTPVRVVELIPPAVDTDLGGPGLHTFGVPVQEFVDAAFTGLERGDEEIAYGFAVGASQSGPQERAAMFSRMNAPR